MQSPDFHTEARILSPRLIVQISLLGLYSLPINSAMLLATEHANSQPISATDLVKRLAEVTNC